MKMDFGSDLSRDTIISFFLERKWILLSLCVVTPAGFLCKSYTGPGRDWFFHYGGGVLYEIFWCLMLFFFWPRRRAAVPIALGVFIITCILEVMQLWHAGFLQQIRSTFLGRALIGDTFVWLDFPHYLLGCLIAWLWMRAILALRR